MPTTANKTTKRDLQRLDENIVRYAKAVQHETDPEDAKVYARDVRDLRAIRDAVARGDLAAARRIINRLDTLVRDQIPVRLYHTIFS